jgi:hypothetical protein
MARPDLHHIKRKLTAILHADVAIENAEWGIMKM